MNYTLFRCWLQRADTEQAIVLRKAKNSLLKPFRRRSRNVGATSHFNVRHVTEAEAY